MAGELVACHIVDQQRDGARGVPQPEGAVCGELAAADHLLEAEHRAGGDPGEQGLAAAGAAEQHRVDRVHPGIDANRDRRLAQIWRRRGGIEPDQEGPVHLDRAGAHCRRSVAKLARYSARMRASLATAAAGTGVVQSQPASIVQAHGAGRKVDLGARNAVLGGSATGRARIAADHPEYRRRVTTVRPACPSAGRDPSVPHQSPRPAQRVGGKARGDGRGG